MTELATTHAHPLEDDCCPGAQGRLMPRERAEDLADVFKALADPARVRLLEYLAASRGGTACACHLPAALGITQPTLSHHLRRLRAAGLVEGDRRGRWVHYTVRPEALDRVRAYLDLPTDGAEDRCC
ncbi:ArsR/SmtB family transcription factor [Ornithinimicrobium pekingense]|uniref:Transcriptional regulator n=1 Tax=Ornithinimicrobium pekingense TaxID=384677 RepID=A0ABQ2FC03_9MICO|nr:metalloregulator ArsR/SmtB family transcription factor [Ornithinimicrobium pekingense]GGK77497.1 transcriptional regulator [Ornithinimicrobium pekingense]